MRGGYGLMAVTRDMEGPLNNLCLMVCTAQCLLCSLHSLHWLRELGDLGRISLSTVVGFLVFVINFATHLVLVTLFRNEKWVWALALLSVLGGRRWIKFIV